MNKDKLILDYCPNFYKIINFDYFEDDVFTEHLIKIYRTYIFSVKQFDDEELTKVKAIDNVLAKYVDDYHFRMAMQKELCNLRFKTKENLLQNLVNSIIGIFEKYEEGQTRNIYIARWI
jgi:hypothetical protein